MDTKITETLKYINVVLNALNSVSVNGKNNLANLSGSISLLEKIEETLEEFVGDSHSVSVAKNKK